MSAPARILLVDDSAVVRGLLTRLIDGQPDLEIAGSAANGKIGVEKARALKPDLIVLDIEMPVMTGLEALVEIRKFLPGTPIVMFSTLTENGAAATVNALALGASDYAAKPQSTANMSAALEMVREELVGKIRALLSSGAARALHARPAAPARTQAAASPKALPATARAAARAQAANPGPSSATDSGSSPVRRVVAGQPQAVVLGSSTGGPHALEVVLGAIKVPLPVPMFITQHMPATFTRVLAQRLDSKAASRIVEVENDMLAEPGTCYIAPGGFHVELQKDGADVRMKTVTTPPINSCRPSVEPMFETAADIYGRRLLAVMLTGMGADGLEGSRRIAGLGAPVVVQDEETSVVWGMPGAVAKAGLASEILALDQIGPRIAQLAGARAGSRARRAVTTGPETTR